MERSNKIKPLLIALLLCCATPLWAADAEPLAKPVPWHVPKPMQRVHGQSFLPQLVGGKGPSKEWVHIEYKNNRQIRTKEWIYTDKGRLTRVNELGRPENRPEKEGDHADARNKMKRIFALIDKEVTRERN